MSRFGSSRRSSIALLAAWMALCGFPAVAADDATRERIIAGPVAAKVLKVRDGDTVEVEALIWPQQVVRTAVRLRDVDAPELKSRCPAEHKAAQAARDRLAALLSGGAVTLTQVSGDKYFGRVLARMSAEGVPDVSRVLLEERLVAPYGGEARRDWCAGAAASVLGGTRGSGPG